MRTDSLMPVAVLSFCVWGIYACFFSDREWDKFRLFVGDMLQFSFGMIRIVIVLGLAAWAGWMLLSSGVAIAIVIAGFLIAFAIKRR